MNFWMYIPKEISDLTDDFAKIFEVNDFYRDYENVWEWIVGNSDWLNSKINVSRKHNLVIGEYEEPLRVIINDKSSDSIDDKIVDKIGRLLSDKFNTEIFYGDINLIEGTNFEHVVKKRFENQS